MNDSVYSDFTKFSHVLSSIQLWKCKYDCSLWNTKTSLRISDPFSIQLFIHKQLVISNPPLALTLYFTENPFIRSQELKQKSILENFHFILSLHIKNIWNFPIVRNGLFDKQLQLKILLFLLIWSYHINALISYAHLACYCDFYLFLR